MAKRRPILHHDIGVALYEPTPSFSAFRLVWKDPDTGDRPNRRFHDRQVAEEAFTQTVEYVKSRQSSISSGSPRRGKAQTVNDVFDSLLVHWNLKGVTDGYVDGRKGIYRTWIGPAIGDLPVQEWARSNRHCLGVMAAARDAGREASTLQGIGSLMRTMVSQAWRENFIPRSSNPMDDVDYVKQSEDENQSVQYVPPSERPTTEMVEALTEQFRSYGEALGHDWLGLMVEVAAYGGLRLGELSALRPCDLDPSSRIIRVQRAWRHAKEHPSTIGPPKNGKRRRVPMRSSTMEALRARAAVVDAEVGPEGLLFPKWQGDGDTPITDRSLRSAFGTCAKKAGWACRPGGVSDGGHRFRGEPTISWRNLRHHCATWLRQQGMEWEDVSKVLGHASVSFTLNRYVRPGAEAEARMLDLLADL